MSSGKRALVHSRPAGKSRNHARRRRSQPPASTGGNGCGLGLRAPRRDWRGPAAQRVHETAVRPQARRWRTSPTTQAWPPSLRNGDRESATKGRGDRSFSVRPRRRWGSTRALGRPNVARPRQTASSLRRPVGLSLAAERQGGRPRSRRSDARWRADGWRAPYQAVDTNHRAALIYEERSFTPRLSWA